MKKKTILLLASLLLWMNLTSFAQQTWKGTWATAVEWTGMGDMPKESLSNRSCRQVVHVSFGGKELRLKLSNEFGKHPVEIKSIYIADTDTQNQSYIQGKTVKYLKFHGKKNVTIEAGKALYSDAIAYSLKAGQLLSITIDYGTTPEHATSHRGSRTTSYIVAHENGKVTKPTDTAFGKQENVDHWYNLSAIEVKSNQEQPVIAVLGNSITDGRGSTTNLQNRWTDAFANHLNGKTSYGVLNLGIGGNSVALGGLSQPAIKRFDRDILEQSGVTHLIIFEGTNDIGGSKKDYEHVADTLITCYKEMIAKAKAKGIKVYMGTITPTKGNSYFSYWHEAVRQSVNEWIRTSKDFDGIIDFDKLVCDPRDPQRLKPEFSDDWLHLNPKGYEEMGRFAAEFILARDKK